MSEIVASTTASTDVLTTAATQGVYDNLTAILERLEPVEEHLQKVDDAVLRVETKVDALLTSLASAASNSAAESST